MPKKNQNKDPIKNLQVCVWISLFLASIACGSVFFIFSSSDVPSMCISKELRLENTKVFKENLASRREMGRVEKELGNTVEELLKLKIARLNKKNIASEKVMAEAIEANTFEISALYVRISKLQQLIFDNPEGTVRLPIVEKELELCKERIDYLNDKIDRLSQIGTWAFGLLLVTLLSYIGLNNRVNTKWKN